MLTFSIRCKTIALLLLVMTSVSPLASAASSRPASQEYLQAVEPAGFELFGHLWVFLHSLHSLGSKAGCDINPDERCKPSPAPQTKAGCDIDPNGHCHS
jgi:hypothetical protein